MDDFKSMGEEENMTLAEYALKLSNKASQGPWLIEHHKGAGNIFRLDNPTSASEFIATMESNKEFISASRTLVPELARRLQKACRILRNSGNFILGNLADDLEKPLEGK